jgi:hypothetical protein
MPVVKIFDGFWTPDPNTVQLPASFLYSHFQEVGELEESSVNLTGRGDVPPWIVEVNAATGATGAVIII